jgi:glycosyltransferase involved in cell wall biosynthesis
VIAGLRKKLKGIAVARETVILTHMLGRFLDDFGNVVRYLEKDGVKVTIYASLPLNTPKLSIDSATLFDEYRSKLPPSIDVKPLPYCRGGKMMPWEALQMFVLGFRLARRHPDAMFQMWSVYVIIACGLPLRIFNRRSLYMVTGLGPVLGSTGKRFRLIRALIFSVYRYLMSGRNSRCLNHNGDDRLFLAERLHADPGKFFVTPGCGVDPEVFPYFEERAGNEHPVVVVPARLIEDKGILEAVEASGILRDRGVVHEMWFTGAVEPYPWIRVTQEDIDRAEERNPYVKFIGYQPSMPPVYQKADIVCLPTRYPEGTPTVLIEAAATGRVAVTCDTVGAREIVVNGETGLVVPQRDTTALADALETIMSSPDLYERMRTAAYAHFRRSYTKDMALETTLAAFESVDFRFGAPKTASDIRITESLG